MAQNAFLTKDIVKELGLEELPTEKQEKALLQIGEIIFRRVMMRVMEELSEEDKDGFGKLLEEKKDDQEAVLSFLQVKLPNFNSLVDEEINGFKKEAVEVMNTK